MRPVQIIEGSKLEPGDANRLIETAGVNNELVCVFADTILWAHELLRSLPIDSQDTEVENQKVVAAVLLARVIEVVESGFLLASRGARLETVTIFRVFLDAYFVLANVCSDARFLSTYFCSDEAERLKLMRAASKRDSEVFRKITEYGSNDVISKLDAKIKAEKIQAYNSFSYAESVGCGDIYDSIYRISSAAVHTSPRALENFIDVDDEGRITHILLRADGKSTNRALFDLHYFFCKALKGVCELFERDSACVEDFASRSSMSMIDP